MLAGSDPGAGKPPTCWLLAQVKNNDFVRVTPAKGFQCDPGGYLNQ
jgi:hypothetical protein